MKRLQSDVEVGATLTVLVDRVDLIDSGIRFSLKLPTSPKNSTVRTPLR
jgi:hypothetical protein